MTEEKIGNTPHLLEVKNLSISFDQYGQGFERSGMDVIRDLSISVEKGEIVAVVGSSGSGKSLLAHAVLDILPYNAVRGGEIYYKGKLLDGELIKELRGSRIVLIPQSVEFLDPLMKTGRQLCRGKKDKNLQEKVSSIFARYRLREDTADLYPFELSGGMARRVLISSAVMEDPDLVIADEPTPGLSSDVARYVTAHFREIADNGAGVILITHDLELALGCADRIVVFYAGETLEEARPSDFEKEETLRHPYTRALRKAMPANGFEPTPGVQPYSGEIREGCAFAPRCIYACSECRKGKIPYRSFEGGYVKCIRAGQLQHKDKDQI